MVSNYYEMLGLATDANTADIHRAVDNRYNEMRQLATHPDATVVEEANRNLRLLEQMRATLTDPTRREVYNAGIGVGGAGGLADPAAILRKATPPPPPRVIMPTPSPSAAPANAAPDLWVCPKCDTRNPEWTQFCLKCQNELVRLCPECGQIKSLVKTGVCGNCGFSFDAATQRAALNSESTNLHEQVSAHKTSIKAMAKKRGFRLRYLQLSILGTVGAMVFCLYTLYTMLIGWYVPDNWWVTSLLGPLAGLVLTLSLWRSYQAIILRITTEQKALVLVDQRFQELSEEYTSLEARKRL